MRKNLKTVKHLTFKEALLHKLVSKFNWDNKESAERYVAYLSTKYKE